MTSSSVIPSPQEETALMGWLAHVLPEDIAGEVMARAHAQIQADRAEEEAASQ